MNIRETVTSIPKQALDHLFGIDKDLIKYLRSLTNEEKKYFVFKTFYNKEDTETLRRLDTMISNIPFAYGNLISSMSSGEAANLMMTNSINNREKYSDILSEYKVLLEQISRLAKELKLTNSLELSNLFTCLLWNGYLSKNKENTYKSENRELIDGLFFTSIMDGIGVCLNHSEMLKDFLVTCGYNSAILVNFIDTNTIVDYPIDIKKIEGNSNINQNRFFSLIISKIFEKKLGNHAFNLIEDNNKLYIYDSTNILLQSINNPYSSEVINGKGKSKLFPYGSYGFCTSEKEYCVIDKLLTTKEFASPYTRGDFIFTNEVNIELFINNTALFNDFYDEVKPSIVKISEETDKAHSRKRTK